MAAPANQPAPAPAPATPSLAPPSRVSMRPPAGPGSRKKKPRRRIKRRWISLIVLTVLVTAVVVVARTQWVAREITRVLQTEVRKATALELDFGYVGFSFRHLAVRVENIRLYRRGQRPIATVGAIEVRPRLLSLFRGKPELTSITVDGGRVELLFRHGELVNGPVIPPQPRQNNPPPPELPFRDVAISDVHVAVVHDELGRIDLPSVDLDVHNDTRGRGPRLLVGVLARGGRIDGARCFNGPVHRLEARAELSNWRDVRVALARVETQTLAVHVREASARVDLHGPIVLDAQVRGPLAEFTCPVPAGAPRAHGDVTVELRAAIDPHLGAHDTPLDLNPNAVTLEASGRVQGQHLAMEVRVPERTNNFLIADDIDLRFHADQDRVTVDSLRAHYAGGLVESPGRAPERPLVLALNRQPPPADRPRAFGVRPSFEGHVDIHGVELHRLLAAVNVTDFAKVLWTFSDISAEAHGEIWRMGEPADLAHPAMWFDVEGQTRNFAILREYHQFQPQVPIIAIPRGDISGQITVDSEHVRFRRLTGLLGPGNRSRVDMAMVQIREWFREGAPDIVLEGGRTTNLYLEDVGRIADLPIAGQVTATVQGGGSMGDPVITGTAQLRNFQFNGLPLGDLSTRGREGWRLQNVRVDIAQMEGRSGQSVFDVRDAYLDFRQYTLRAGARVASNAFVLADYFHMFKFEGDPTFSPFEGRTMPRCAAATLASVQAAATPCVDARDPHNLDPRRPAMGGGAGGDATGAAGGRVEADVSFVLGRPGDDPEGVLDVGVNARDLTLRVANEARTNVETLSHVDARVRYTWLHRSRGFRGARLALDYVRARYAGGNVEVSGNVALGGVMHFVANARNVALAQTDLLRGAGVTGTANGSAVLEGLPDAQRWTADIDIRDLTAAQRNLGAATLSVRAIPEARSVGSTASAAPSAASTASSARTATTTSVRASAAPGASAAAGNARPPRNRFDITAVALGGALNARTSVSVPWEPMTWRDADGVTHPDWSREWGHSEVSGTIELTRNLDLVPFLPTRLLARLGSGARGSARARVEIEQLRLDRWRDARARAAVTHLAVGAQNLGVALAPNEVLGVCLNGGAYWVDPAAATPQGARACAAVPPRLRGRVALTHGEAPMPAARFVGPEGTRFGIAGGGTVAGRLALNLRGEADLARFASLAPGVTWARGTGNFQVNVTGDTDAPQLAGTLSLDNGALGASILPSPVEDIDLLVRFDGTEIGLDRASAHFGASSIDLTGGVAHLSGRGVDRVDVPLTVRNLALTPQQGIEVALDADARLLWSPGEELPLFTGDINLTRVRYTRPINMSQDLSGNVNFGGNEGAEPPYDPRDDNVRLDLRLHARDPIRVTNNLVDAEIRIAEDERAFRVLGTDQRIGVVGTLTVPRGRVMFRGNDFDVRRGRIEFDNPERVQPNFDVSAATEIRRGNDAARNQWRVALHAYGTTDRFNLDMTSDPALSREDIALLLTFRMTRAELDQLGAGAFAQSVAAEALATATGLDRTVRNAIPIIDDFRIGTGWSPAQGRTVPQVSIGRRISDRVRVGATVNTTEQREMRATGDVQIDPRTSVQFGYDNFNDQGTSAFGNVGVDLRWRLEFE